MVENQRAEEFFIPQVAVAPPTLLKIEMRNEKVKFSNSRVKIFFTSSENRI